jgi:hypothetical protein
MSQLITEILLRLAKLVASGIMAAILYVVAVAVAGVSPSFEVAALCWISASVALLQLESSPL